MEPLNSYAGQQAGSRLGQLGARLSAYELPLNALGLTAVFIGYLSVWLPNPAAGLSFLGLEIGEWVKFLPQVRSGEVVASRNLFYLPPITLGLMLVLLTAGWPNRRWQTWGQRLLGLAVALLAFPAIEVIRDEASSEWQLRLWLIAMVAAIVVLSPFLGRPFLGRPFLGRSRMDRWPRSVSGLLLVLIGLAGAFLPLWAYLAVRPAVAQVLGMPVGIGAGVWLNVAGHLLVTAVAGVKRERVSSRFTQKDDAVHRLSR